MKKQGYNDIAALLGGFQTWEKESRPVDKKN
jgi:3-mercaptopyruvate sulfurtransferase SseA